MHYLGTSLDKETFFSSTKLWYEVFSPDVKTKLRAKSCNAIKTHSHQVQSIQRLWKLSSTWTSHTQIHRKEAQNLQRLHPHYPSSSLTAVFLLHLLSSHIYLLIKGSHNCAASEVGVLRKLPLSSSCQGSRAYSLKKKQQQLKISVAFQGTRSYHIYGNSTFQMLTEWALEGLSFFFLQCHLYELGLLLVFWLPPQRGWPTGEYGSLKTFVLFISRINLLKEV